VSLASDSKCNIVTRILVIHLVDLPNLLELSFHEILVLRLIVSVS